MHRPALPHHFSRTTLVISLCAVFGSSSSSVTVWADDANTPQSARVNSPFPMKPRLPYVRDKKEFKRDVLSREPELPNLPHYSGQAKFIACTVMPGSRGGATYALSYSCKDAPDQILQWWKQALAGDKWSIGNVRGDTFLTATKQGNFLNVVISRPTKPGSKCDMNILYRTNNSWTGGNK